MQQPPPPRLEDSTRRRWHARWRRRLWWDRLRVWFGRDPGPEADLLLQGAQRQWLSQEAAFSKAGVAKMVQLMGYWQTETLDPIQVPSNEIVFDRMPAVAPALVRQVVREDLGQDPEQLFSSWDEVPFAAASLGQVHSVTGPAGEPWAVKIQYPDAAAALAADVADPSLLEQLVGITGIRLLPEAYAALQRVLLQEVDYLQEMSFLRRFRRAFSRNSSFVFPEEQPVFCTGRVLTSTRLQGTPLLFFLQMATEPQRDRVTALLFDFGMRASLQHRLLNADPNPGNFLVFSGADQLGLVDFGSCVQLSDAQGDLERDLWRALIAADAECFRLTLYNMGIVQHPVELDTSPYRHWEDCLSAPLRSASFSWTPAYARTFLAATERLLRDQAFTWPASFLLLWRQRMGLVSLLGRCGGRMDVRAALQSML